MSLAERPRESRGSGDSMRIKAALGQGKSGPEIDDLSRFSTEATPSPVASTRPEMAKKDWATEAAQS